MKIEIEYEASWRNSFLDGDNNEALPDKGRKYIASNASLGKAENYIKRDVTLNTVMGILSRLIGDQRKLYQARQDEKYYFADIEKLIIFHDEIKVKNDEIVYLRNMTGNTDRNSFAGILKGDDKLFTSDYSKEFWNILSFDFDELLAFIADGTNPGKEVLLDPISISNRFDKIGKLKAVALSAKGTQALIVLNEKFEGMSYKNEKDQLTPSRIYCAALYLQLERLSKSYDLSSGLTKNGVIPGVSKCTFTKKDFMGRFTSGAGKKVLGNPYIIKSYVKGDGQTVSALSKVSGTLTITLNVSRERAKELEQMIVNAGVSSFYLGKKGLAYVTQIDTREVG